MGSPSSTRSRYFCIPPSKWLSETQSSFLQTDKLPLCANHQMVKHINIEQLSRLHDFARNRGVFGAGCRVAAGMIVREDNARRILTHGIPKEFTDADNGGMD